MDAHVALAEAICHIVAADGVETSRNVNFTIVISDFFGATHAGREVGRGASSSPVEVASLVIRYV